MSNDVQPVPEPEAGGSQITEIPPATDTEPQEPPLTRSTDFWFSDGNIVLQVESTQFRVHKGILSMHSPVFLDMFKMPQPADEAAVDGCAVVVLAGDTAQDWVHLLGAMYPKTLHNTPPVHILAAVLRLGKKYDLPSFRKDALRRLKVELPTTLDEWDELEDNWSLVEHEDGMEFRILAFARELDLHSILPLMYYIILAGNSGRNLSKLLDNTFDMNPTDRLACLQGYFRILDLQSTTTMAWLDTDSTPSSDCRSFERCNAGVKAIMSLIFKPSRPSIYVVRRWDKDWNTHLCSDCLEASRSRFNSGRKTCFAKLPSIFGLPDWPDLISLDFE
ncbi:hypothetical protein B0H10DRAFT_1791251 [Mycena sp. CBHHK59/15]|nr:hypothetical protein B0H10DRAFT_1791251 [Mycena sp. CBHHK59/15]